MHSFLGQRVVVATEVEHGDQGMGIERHVHSYSRPSTRFRTKDI